MIAAKTFKVFKTLKVWLSHFDLARPGAEADKRIQDETDKLKKTRRSLMKNSLTFKIAFAFFCLYGLFNFTGIIFFTGWSEPSTLDSIVLTFYKFPVDWVYLIVEISVWFLLLNVLFWSAIVYLLVLLIIKIRLYLYKENDRV